MGKSIFSQILMQDNNMHLGKIKSIIRAGQYKFANLNPLISFGKIDNQQTRQKKKEILVTDHVISRYL